MKYRLLTHNDRFAKSQSAYLKTKNSNELSKMYLVAASYSLIKLEDYCESHKIFIPSGELQIKAYDCASYIIEQYLTREDFCIEKLSSYAHFVVLKILGKDKKWEMTVESFL